MNAELMFLPGLFKMVFLAIAIIVLFGILQYIDKWLSSRRRRYRDKAANQALEAKRHVTVNRDYNRKLESELRASGIPIDNGFLASISGDKYVS
jgi:hypothetical protein